jgi:hypothetical protein
MNDTNNTATATAAAPARTPSHIAYQVRDREGKKSVWTRLGSAWAHADNRMRPANHIC